MYMLYVQRLSQHKPSKVIFSVTAAKMLLRTVYIFVCLQAIDYLDKVLMSYSYEHLFFYKAC